MVKKGILPLVLALGISTSAYAWTPPDGIPTPPICAGPEAWPTPTIYVSEATGNDANPGTITSPRATIPRTIGPGVYVYVSGNYTTTHEGAERLTFAGTSYDSPSFIMGPATVTAGKWEVVGHYGIIDISKFNGSGSAVVIGGYGGGAADTYGICVQNTEFDGQFGGRGVVVQANDGTATTYVAYDIVILGNTIHHLGDQTYTTDDDAHCTSIYKPTAHHIYILDNVLHHCSGDGVQINATNTSGYYALVQKVYFGHNICYSNRQSCGWAKESSFVVMAANVCHDIRPDVIGNPGNCFGGQYIWRGAVIIKNAGFDAENCIGFQSASFPTGTTVALSPVIAGNTCWDIHNTVGTNTAHNAFNSGACVRVQLGGSGHQYIVNNTCTDVDYGIVLNQNAETTTYWNNIINDYTTAAVMFIDSTKVASNSGWSLYPASPVTVDIDYITRSVTVAPGGTTQIGDPDFNNPATNDYRVTLASPAANNGRVVDLDSGHLAIHGVAININTNHIGSLGTTDSDVPDPPDDPPVGPSSGTACTCGSIQPA